MTACFCSSHLLFAPSWYPTHFTSTSNHRRYPAHTHWPLCAGGLWATADEPGFCSLHRDLPVSSAHTASLAASKSHHQLAETQSSRSEQGTSSDAEQLPTPQTQTNRHRVKCVCWNIPIHTEEILLNFVWFTPTNQFL